MKVLLAAGAVVAVVGMIALSIGYPNSDTSFGNAMMIDGVIVLCTGLLIMALSVISRQLDRIADLLGDRPAVLQAERGNLLADADVVAADPTPPLFPAAEPVIDAPREAAPPPASEMGARSLATPVAPVPAPDDAVTEPATPTPAERPRRNLLFESRRRDKTQVAASEPKPLAPLPTELPKPSFDDAWSGSAPPRPDAAGSAPAAETPAAPPPAPAATVIKSGVVDGMAYSLYSDGSIEAQMPKEGLIRFASLDALRDYLDQKQ